jgi:hypothetical protein
VFASHKSKLENEVVELGIPNTWNAKECLFETVDAFHEFTHKMFLAWFDEPFGLGDIDVLFY